MKLGLRRGAVDLLEASLVAAMVLALGSPSEARSDARARPNVLLIVVDDLKPALGAYGNVYVKTPHIDRLAMSGIRFDHAYSQSPLCNPSRTSMLTARYPTETDVWDNTTWFGAIHPEFVSLPAFFRQHGYRTLRAGKIYHRYLDETEAWSEGGKTRKILGEGRAIPESMVAGNMDRIDPLEGDGESHHDYKNATRAIQMIERNKNERFFLAVGLSKPHVPLSAPRHMLDLYADIDVPLPVDFAPRPTVPVGFPRFSVPPNTDLFVGRDATPAAAREMIRAYYASVSFSDANVGRVLAALDRFGLRNDTVIVLWSDHGFHLGEKGKWSKNDSLFEIALKVPLIVASPEHASSAGKASRRVVQSLDIYATLADLCGLPRPPAIRGRSLRPLLEAPAAPWPHPAYSLTRFGDGAAVSVRTEDWRYSAWPNGETLLFDHRQDPAETRNLANDPAYRDIVRRMRGYTVQIPRWGIRLRKNSLPSARAAD